jgi:hypothetical protein
MTLELWNTFATFGTFVVIAATAIAALVQLRHLRGSNQIAALTELQHEVQTPQFAAAEHFVRTELASKLKDPEFRYQIAKRHARTSEFQTLITKVNTVGNYYDTLGLLVKTGLVDRDLALNMLAVNGAGAWDDLAPAGAIFRRKQGDTIWENFEYFVVLSKEWIAAHPTGDYPADVSRIGLKDEWREADALYAASRAPDKPSTTSL